MATSYCSFYDGIPLVRTESKRSRSWSRSRLKFVESAALVETMGHETPGAGWAPDREPMEFHRTSRVSRSKDNGLPDLEALNQDSMGLLQIPYPLELDGAPCQELFDP